MSREELERAEKAIREASWEGHGIPDLELAFLKRIATTLETYKMANWADWQKIVGPEPEPREELPAYMERLDVDGNPAPPLRPWFRYRDNDEG